MNTGVWHFCLGFHMPYLGALVVNSSWWGETGSLWAVVNFPHHPGMVWMCGWEWVCLWETSVRSRIQRQRLFLPIFPENNYWTCSPMLHVALKTWRLCISQQIISKILNQYSWSSICLRPFLFSKLKPNTSLFFNSPSLVLSSGSFLNIASLFFISTYWNFVHVSSANPRIYSFTVPFLLHWTRLRFRVILSVKHLS